MKLFLLSVLVIVSLAALYPVKAQQPFYTDDSDVTETGKFHFELSDELDKLQVSSLPIAEQNGARATLAYGAFKNAEVSVGGAVLTLIGSRDSPAPRFVSGIGDTTFAVKYNFYHEKEKSRLPAFAVSGFVQLPTGDARRSLGSGITDYGFYLVAQKTLSKKGVVRLNAGSLFAGNTLMGVEGISQVKGKVFTGAASFVRKINERLQLGAEVTGAATGNFNLSKGQLQTQLGGNYQIAKKLTFDFGLIAGRFAASPRLGFQIGTSIDF